LPLFNREQRASSKSRQEEKSKQGQS